jgi:translocation and assembly module TamB
MEEKKKRSVWRRLAWTALGIVIALPVLAVLALLLLRTSPVQSYVLDLVRTELAIQGVDIGAVSGAWPDEIIAENVTVSDESGVWLRAARARILWSSWSLLGSSAAIDSVELSQITMLREPVSSTSDVESELFSWPDLPLALEVKAIRGDVIIDRAVTGEEVALVIEGAGQLDSAQLDLRLAAQQTNGGSVANIRLRSSSDLRSLKIVADARDARIAAALSKMALNDLVLRADIAREDDVWTGGFYSESAGYGALEGTFVQDSFVRFRVAEARPLATQFGVPVSGSLEALVRVLAMDPEDGTSLEIFADTSLLKADDELLSALLEDGRVSGKITLSPDSSFSFENVTGALAAGRVKTTARGRFNSDDSLEADVTAEVADLSVLRPQAGGTASLHAVISGPSAAPLFDLDLTGADVRHGELQWSQVTGTARLDAQGLGEASLNAGGAVPIALAAELSREGEIRIADINGKALGADVKANARLEEDGPTGSALISAPSLAPIGKFLGVALNGSATADGTFVSEKEALRVDAKISGKQIKYETVTLTSVQATAKGPTSTLDFSAQANGQYEGEKLTFNAAGVFNGEAEQLNLARLKVTQGETDIALARATEISLRAGFKFDKAQLNLARKKKPAGTVVISAAKDANGLRADAAASEINLRSLTDNEVSGTASLKASFDGGKGIATATAEAKRVRALSADTRVAPPLDVVAKANWQSGRVGLDGSATGRNLQPATFHLSTRMARAPDGGIPELAPAAPLEGDVRWTGRIGPLFSAFDFPGHTLDGDSDVNIGITGTVSKPQLLGNAVIKNGRYENELTGSTLTDLALNLEARATSARLTVTGKDGGRGTLNGDMTMDLGRGIGSASGRLNVSDALLLKRDDVTARLTGELQVISAQGEDGALRLAGKMTANDVTARLPKSLPPDVVVIDVVDPAAPPPPVDENVKPNKSVPIELDLGVDIPGPATVEGRGLKSLWKGNLAVKGLVSAPEISGKLTAMRGGLDLAGQQLELDRGEIIFDSGTTIDPQVDVAFEGKSEDIETEIILKGRVSTLKIEAKSTPPLPPDEVLALALFGKPSTELSAGEALQLVRSVAQLTGQTGGGYDLVSELQSSLGVDVLRVEGLTGSDGPSVTAGKYVSEQIYLGVRQGAKPGSTAATAEIEITDEITAETDVGQDATSSVGLNWKRDY